MLGRPVHRVLDRRFAARAWSKELKKPWRSCLAWGEMPLTDPNEPLMVDESELLDEDGLSCRSPDE